MGWIILIPEERCQKILHELTARRVVPVSDLSWMLSVSTRTIRRDLTELERRGLVRRVHGGATLAEMADFDDPSIEDREVSFVDEKQRIGKAAASLIRRRDCILLDSGTTTLEVARYLPQDYDLTVVTTTLPIANELAQRDDINLVMIGGSYYEAARAFVGPLTEQNLRVISADIAFISCVGIDLTRGLTNTNLFESTKRVMMEVARKSVVVADRSKFGKRALAIFGVLEDVDAIVTDSGLDETIVAELHQNGIRVVLA